MLDNQSLYFKESELNDYPKSPHRRVFKSTKKDSDDSFIIYEYSLEFQSNIIDNQYFNWMKMIRLYNIIPIEELIQVIRNKNQFYFRTIKSISSLEIFPNTGYQRLQLRQIQIHFQEQPSSLLQVKDLISLKLFQQGMAESCQRIYNPEDQAKKTSLQKSKTLVTTRTEFDQLNSIFDFSNMVFQTGEIGTGEPIIEKQQFHQSDNQVEKVEELPEPGIQQHSENKEKNQTESTISILSETIINQKIVDQENQQGQTETKQLQLEVISQQFSEKIEQDVQTENKVKEQDVQKMDLQPIANEQLLVNNEHEQSQTGNKLQEEGQEELLRSQNSESQEGKFDIIIPPIEQQAESQQPVQFEKISQQFEEPKQSKTDETFSHSSIQQQQSDTFSKLLQDPDSVQLKDQRNCLAFNNINVDNCYLIDGHIFIMAADFNFFSLPDENKCFSNCQETQFLVSYFMGSYIKQFDSFDKVICFLLNKMENQYKSLAEKSIESNLNYRNYDILNWMLENPKIIEAHTQYNSWIYIVETPKWLSHVHSSLEGKMVIKSPKNYQNMQDYELEDVLKRAKRELEIMELLSDQQDKHLPIVCQQNYFKIQEQWFIFLQYYDGRDLQQLIQERSDAFFTLECIYRMACQIFDALRKLHKLNIIHRDLKPQNILVKNKDNPNKIELFIADFDWSKQFTKKSIENTAHFATKQYAPKEFDGEQEIYDERSDVWQAALIGIILINNFEVFQLFLKGEYIWGWDISLQKNFTRQKMTSEITKRNNGSFDQDFIDLLSQCLKENFNDRPKSEEVYQKLKNLKFKQNDVGRQKTMMPTKQTNDIEIARLQTSQPVPRDRQDSTKNIKKSKITLLN